jgi:hypothetical protein
MKHSLKALEGNIWKYTVHLATNKRSYMTFLTIFLLTMPNATANTIGLLTLVSQLVAFVFEVPSGYVSDKIGHKNALVIARIFLVLSTTCFIFATSIIWFFIGSALLAIGSAFSSGTGSAFMHDTLTALGKGKKYASIMGKASSIGYAVPIIFIIVLAFVAQSDFRLAFVVALLIDIVGLVAVFLMNSPSRESHKVEEVGIKNFVKTLKEFVNIGWLPFVLAGSIMLGLNIGSVMGFRNPYQEFLGFSILMIGILWALSRVIVSGLLLTNGWIYKKFSLKQFMILRSVIYAVSFLGVGLSTNKWAIAAFFIVSVAGIWGLKSAQGQYYLEYIKNSRSKATLLSLIELINKVLIAGVGISMGLLVTTYSYQSAYFVIGIAFVFVMFGISILLPKR